jgi:hypothetical protein
MKNLPSTRGTSLRILFLATIVLSVFGMANHGYCSVIYKQNVDIKKIAASKDGSFLYIDPALISTCAVSSAQTGTFGVLYITNHDVLAILLSAQVTGKKIRLLVASDNVGPFSPTYVATTTCQIEEIEIE